MIPLCLVAGVVARDWPARVVSAAVAVALVAVVAPRAWGTGEDRDGLELRVMTANLRVGGADAATIVRLVRDNRVDLLALQEFTPQAQADLTRAGLDALLPHRVADPEPLAPVRVDRQHDQQYVRPLRQPGHSLLLKRCRVDGVVRCHDADRMSPSRRFSRTSSHASTPAAVRETKATDPPKMAMRRDTGASGFSTWSFGKRGS